jgi:hypothetical protein
MKLGQIAVILNCGSLFFVDYYVLGTRSHMIVRIFTVNDAGEERDWLEHFLNNDDFEGMHDAIFLV